MNEDFIDSSPRLLNLRDFVASLFYAGEYTY